MLLKHDAFLTELTRLFESTRESGSLSLTHKRVSETVKGDDGDVTTHRLLIRARTEKKKISTFVHAKDLLKFQASLSNILRSHMTTLKRKDRSKKSS